MENIQGAHKHIKEKRHKKNIMVRLWVIIWHTDVFHMLGEVAELCSLENNVLNLYYISFLIQFSDILWQLKIEVQGDL